LTSIIFNTIGTIGVAVILSSYFLLQTHRIESTELRYSILNFIGSSMILISLFHDFNLPSAIVEGVWALISLLGIARWYLHRKKTASKNV
jgi:paired small multidrug resistance pump